MNKLLIYILSIFFFVACNPALDELASLEDDIPCSIIEKNEVLRFKGGRYYGLTPNPDSMKVVIISNDIFLQDDSLSLIIDDDLNYSIYLQSGFVNAADSSRELAFSEKGGLEIAEYNFVQDAGGQTCRDVAIRFIAEDGSTSSISIRESLFCPVIFLKYSKKIGLTDSVSMNF